MREAWSLDHPSLPLRLFHVSVQSNDIVTKQIRSFIESVRLISIVVVIKHVLDHGHPCFHAGEVVICKFLVDQSELIPPALEATCFHHLRWIDHSDRSWLAVVLFNRPWMVPFLVGSNPIQSGLGLLQVLH